MKKLLLCATIAVAMCFASCEKFDASEILDRLDNLENQLEDGILEDKIAFTDPRTKFICTFYWDENGDGELSYEEAENVTDLGRAFNGVEIISFMELQYFTGITSLPDLAFNGNVSLNKIAFPNTLVSIGEFVFGNSTFTGNNNIEEITLPAGLINIGSGAFYWCKNLRCVYCQAVTPPIIEFLHGGHSSVGETYLSASSFPDQDVTYYVPRESLDAYKAADGWKHYASDIEGYDF
jgi:hypothetical protein